MATEAEDAVTDKTLSTGQSENKRLAGQAALIMRVFMAGDQVSLHDIFSGDSLNWLAVNNKTTGIQPGIPIPQITPQPIGSKWPAHRTVGRSLEVSFGGDFHERQAAYKNTQERTGDGTHKQLTALRRQNGNDAAKQRKVKE